MQKPTNYDETQVIQERVPAEVGGHYLRIIRVEEMKNKMSPHASLEILTEYSHRVNKLQYLADRLEESNGWDSHMIQRDGDSDYRIYHLFVNYAKKEGNEYRIGIFVDESNMETDA